MGVFTFGLSLNVCAFAYVCALFLVDTPRSIILLTEMVILLPLISFICLQIQYTV